MLLMATGLTLLGLFLYKNLYQTIIQSKEVILLRQEVAPDIINISKVESILNSLDKKTKSTESINWLEIKNHFNSGS